MNNLVGVVSLLDSKHDAQVRRIWEGLKTECAWTGPNPKDVPHFSWHVAESYDEEHLAGTLLEICSRWKPFMVQTAGIGIFAAEKPVIYIALVKNQHLIQLHHMLWERLQGLGQGVSPYYAPDAWMPHITVAYEGVNPQSIGCLMQELAFKPLRWDIMVDNLIMVGRTVDADQHPLIRFSFTG